MQFDFEHRHIEPSLGEIAPGASTDIAIGLERLVSIACSYATAPPHIRKPNLLILHQTIDLP